MARQDSSWHPYWGKESIITAVAFGGFLVLLGVISAITPDFFGKIEMFFRDLTTSPFPPDTASGFMLPVPFDLNAHKVLYTAVFQFDIGFGILQAAILAMRLAVRSKIGKIAETVEHTFFWFGAAALTNAYLLPSTITRTLWFQYWALLIILIGAGILIRASIVIAAKSRSKHKSTMVT